MSNFRETAGVAGQRTFMQSLVVYATPVMISMLILGFASGLPLYMVFQKLSYWLRDAGIDRSTIGFFYFVTLAYTLKWLWAPVVDRVKIPLLSKRLGTRRAWMVTAIAGTVIALGFVATTDPTGASYRRDDTGMRLAQIEVGEYQVLLDSLATAEADPDRSAGDVIGNVIHPVEAVLDEFGAQVVELPEEEYRRLLSLVREDEHFEALSVFRTLATLLPIAIAALLLAYSGATLDVAIDAWRIESASNDMQATMAAAYSFGYRIAYMTSGLGLAISEWSNWHVSFLVMAAAMAISAGLVFFMKEPKAGVGRRALEGSFGVKVVNAVWQPFKDFFARLGWWIIPVVALISLYRISDFTMGVMASPLYSDLEFDRAVVGGIQAGPGLAATMFGLFVGGVTALRIGMMRALVIGLVITLVTNGAYAWLAATAQPDESWKLLIAIVGDNLAGGFVTTVFIAYLSSLVDPASAATQYAWVSSFYALFAKFLSGFSGVLADAVGWVAFFVITAAWTIPAAILLAVVIRFGPAAARGEHKFAERQTE
ncbi:MAG: PAT family beta-lactamase induction signal transducer AmpG [Maricaulis maris]|jgi:PAT family beta-lactamase induction signal transducer AmpG